MSFEDFFEEVEVEKEEEEKQNPPLKIKNKINEIKEEAKGEQLEQKKNIGVNNEKKEKLDTTAELETKYLDIGSDVSDVFLLDVTYESDLNLAQCLFYHEETRSIYKWNDTTGHKPYLLTDISKDTLEGFDKLIQSEEFDSMDEVMKVDLLEGRQKKYTRVFGKTPLSIGGTGQSMRNLIEPSYEADIRYHLNYIADRGLTPGTFYNIKKGKLLPKKHTIDPSISNELKKSFAGEAPQRMEMLDNYMPLLFQEIPTLLRCAFDIEVGSEKSKMPNVNNPEYPVISIAMVDTDGRKIIWVLNREEVNQVYQRDDVKIKRFDQELDLISDFMYIIDQYPIILTFNGDNFDCPYIVNRAMKLGGDKKDIPIILRRNSTQFRNSIHIDLHQFFRQASIRLYAFSGKYESASLDGLSKALLGAGKLEHPEVWISDMDLETLVKYNVLDSELTLQLSQFDNNIAINLMIILMRISKMPLFDFSRSAVSRWLHMWLVFEHRQRGYIVPRKEDIQIMKGGGTSDAIIDGKKFQGAIVLEPNPGVWWNVHVLDFASLYPSIIKTKNLSYETIRCDHDECKNNIVPEVNHWICEKQEGMFSILLGFIRDTRVKWFKHRAKKSNPDEEDRRINHIIQASLKVLINAGYGVVGSEAFDFYCLPVAESTTAYARDAIMATRNYIEKELKIRVIYGDTDSVFILDPTPEQVQDVMDWGDKNIGIELGTDYEFRYAVFSNRKKNYFGILKDGGAIVKGLMAKKSNTPQIIRDTFTDMLESLKVVKNPTELEIAKQNIRNLISGLVNNLENGNFSVEEISIRTTLTRKVSEYTTWTPALQAIAQLVNAGIRKIDQFQIGDRIEYVKTTRPIQVRIPEGFSFSVNEIRSASVQPVDLIKDNSTLNGKAVIDSTESTFSQILKSLDISWDKIMGKTALDDFF